MNSTEARGDKDTNFTIVQHSRFTADHVDYSWLLLAVLALGMIVLALRQVVRNKERD